MTQLEFSDHAEQPAARGSDPATSKMAALLGGRSVHKALVCRALFEHGPMHDEKIAEVIGRPKSATIKRRGDLVVMGLAEPATLHGQPVHTVTRAGAQTMVWRLTAAGRDAARRLAPLVPDPDAARLDQIEALLAEIRDFADDAADAGLVESAAFLRSAVNDLRGLIR